MAAWARAKLSREPKAYSAPKSVKKSGLKNAGISTRRAVVQNTMIAI